MGLAVSDGRVLAIFELELAFYLSGLSQSTYVQI